jgi:hypothetical protein
MKWNWFLKNLIKLFWKPDFRGTIGRKQDTAILLAWIMSFIHSYMCIYFIKTSFMVHNKRFNTLNQEQLFLTGNKNQLTTSAWFLCKYPFYKNHLTGLQISAGHRTLSGQILPFVRSKFFYDRTYRQMSNLKKLILNTISLMKPKQYERHFFHYFLLH